MPERRTRRTDSGQRPSRGKEQIYEQFARVGKALASPTRLQLLDLLAQGERSVDALAQQASLEIASTSQHLRALAAARLVDTRREGQRVVYRIADPSVLALFHALRDAAEKQLAEVGAVARAYLGAEDGLPPIDRAELSRRLKDGSVIVIDVRPREEFAQGHIRGAISVPPGEVAAWAERAPRRKEIVAYCRGPYCVYADEAVRELRRHGFSASRLEDGFPEWKRAGLPVAMEA
jgi:rhodanese-related sulfurtransferase/DNA-binding transcriptional ArsR family regulator